ncbi:hypothetical protein [Pseudomonas citrulli]|uniref:Fibronectin type-III domain-containing protein n=1 Tax=Pseudomonas citrulli TaxID=3064347 RepID=A0ABT9BYU0_9PSED|nr:hypothetical protein [Pseudomonas sp. K18]MDO7897190.1 hypothetical protein [Pseudomonas sp. K18]
MSAKVGSTPPSGQNKAIIPSPPRELTQQGGTKYSLVLGWLISANAAPSDIIAHTFKVVDKNTGQEQPTPATTVAPGPNGWYRHEINVSGLNVPLYYLVKVRAQGTDGNYGEYCPEVEFRTYPESTDTETTP